MTPESEILFSKIFREGPLGMVYCDKTFKFIKVNSSLCKMLGYTEKELLKMTFLQITHPDFTKDNIKFVNKLFKGEIPVYKTEKIYIRKNKEPFWGSVTVTKIADENGNFQHFFSMIEDIDEHKKAQQAMEVSEKKYRNLHESMIDGFVSVDMDGRIIEFNEIYRKMLGYTSEELVKLKYQDITPKKWAKFEKKIVEEQISARGYSDVYEKEYIRKDGTIFPVELHTSLIKDENGKNIGMRAIARDISERKNLELKLYESLKKYQSIFDNANIGIYCTTQDGRILICNPALVRMLGFDSFEELSKRNLEKEGFVAGNSREHFRKNLEMKGKIQEVEAIWKKKDGTYIYVSESAVVINDKKEKVLYYEGMVEDITERKKAQDDAQRISWEWQTTFDTVKESVWLLDEEQRIIRSNKATEIMFGKKNCDIIGRHCYEIVHGTTEPLKCCPILKMRKSKHREFLELQVNRNWFDVTVDPILDNAGNITGAVHIISDITERKEKEEKLIEAKNYIENLINHTSAPIMVWDTNFCITLFNRAFENITGYKSEDVIDKEFNFLFPKETKNKSFEEIGRTLSGGNWESVEIPILCKDGTVKIILWNSANIFDNDGKSSISTIAQGIDITERKRTEKLLMESEENYRTLVENQGEGIGITDLNETFIFANPAAHEIFGVPKGSLVGANLSDFISTESFKQIKKHTELKKLNKKSLYEVEIYRPDGDNRNILITTTPRFDGHNQLTGSFGIFRDITERKIYEKELLDAKVKAEESEKIKASFLANMSHELRTPMVGILGYTELLREKAEDEETKEMIESIHLSGKRLMDTLNLILDLSLIERGKINVDFKKIDIVSISNDVLNLFQASAQKKNLKLELKSLFENYHVNLDEKLFYQIISNLVINGIKYTKSGGVIVEILSETDSGNEWAVLKVIDTGIGIPEDMLDVIFEEFRQVSEGYSRSFEGTGLGLTITKNFVMAMNGIISVESKHGSGSVFTVKFPLSNKPLSNAINIKLLKNENQEILLKPGNYTILCVDDDETNNNLVEVILKDNYKIDFALNAEQGIDMSRSNKYDVILMDINLGYGMTGMDVVKDIRKSTVNKITPIVALTAFAMMGDMQEFLANGCDYYLSKPYSSKTLKELVKKAINKAKD